MLSVSVIKPSLLFKYQTVKVTISGVIYDVNFYINTDWIPLNSST